MPCTNNDPCLKPTIGYHAPVCNRAVAQGIRPKELPALSRATPRPSLRVASQAPEPSAPDAIYTFIVPGEPVTWKRARRGVNGSYTDPKDEAHREKIRAAARNAGVRAPLAGPVALVLWFFRGNSDDPTALCTGDGDNLTKSVKDALRGIAFEDDRQVTDLIVRKRIDRATPRTEVVVSRGMNTATTEPA